MPDPIPSRDAAFALLSKYNKDSFHIRHALTVEGVMRWFACNEGYADVSWPHEAPPEEILLIHALCVHPDFGGRGYGGELVRFAQERAAETGTKLMRLDVLKGNLPAERLYPGCGFRLVDTVTLFYEDTGWTEFEMFEYVV